MVDIKRIEEIIREVEASSLIKEASVQEEEKDVDVLDLANELEKIASSYNEEEAINDMREPDNKPEEPEYRSVDNDDDDEDDEDDKKERLKKKLYKKLKSKNASANFKHLRDILLQGEEGLRTKEAQIFVEHLAQMIRQMK